MTVFNPATANMTVPILPPPAKNIIDLLASYGIQYPGNAEPTPPIELIRMSDVGNPDATVTEAIYSFLNDVYPKVKPSSSTSVALSFVSNATVDPATLSGIYNFYTITNNAVSDIVPPGMAVPFNAAITDLEATYSQYAQSFIMGLFTAHMNDIIDNPHHDSGANLLDVWVDFFQALYNAYIATSPSNPATLDAFIFDKTTALDIATNPGYTDPSQALFVVPVEIIIDLIATHNVETDSLVHPTLQSTLTAETTLPYPTLYMTPSLFFDRYPVISTPTTINPGTPPAYAMYYAASPLNSCFPLLNGTLLIHALISMNSSDTVPIVSFTNSQTTDSIIISKIGGVQGYQVVISYQENQYVDTINVTTTDNDILFILTYTSTGITITHLDQNGNQISSTATIESLRLNFDTIQIGVPIASIDSGLTNTIQNLSLYPSAFTSDQITLMFNTITT